MANSISTLPYSDQRPTRFYVASLDTAATVQDLDGGATQLNSLKAEVASGSDFVLAWDDTSPSLGVTAPIFQIPTTTDVTLEFLGGLAFSNGLTIAATNVGGTAASGNPTATNTVSVVVQ